MITPARPLPAETLKSPALIQKIGDAHVVQKSRSQLKIVDARRLARNEFHTADPQIFAVTAQNSFTRATGGLGTLGVNISNFVT
jgi:hypothetical protein